MLKQVEIYKLSQHNKYGICGGIIITRNEQKLRVNDFALENINSIDFNYLIFLVDKPSMEGINAERYTIINSFDIKNLGENYFLDTNINVGKEFSVFMLKWRMLSQIKVYTIDEFLKDIKTRGEKYCSKLKKARVGDIFRYNGEEYAYIGIEKPREHIYIGMDKPMEHIEDFDCHIALLDRNNEVQCVFGVTFLFDFEKIGDIDIPVDDKYLSFEEYKKIKGLTWLI